MSDFKLENLITNKDCITLGKSLVVKQIISHLNGIDDVTAGNYTLEHAMQCRNYLMFMLCITNALRASNLINMTVEDITKAVYDKEFDALVIKSTRYKTSILYGRKSIVCSEELYGQLQKFVTYFRPKFIKAENESESLAERKVFPANNGEQQLSHSVISNGLTNLFQSIPELKSKKK